MLNNDRKREVVMSKEVITREGCREIQLNILECISNICKENDIKYSLAYGTLIGAIRHKGFIPWDDDIDICLLRNDYEKLIYILRNQTEYAWLSLEDNRDEGYYVPFAKAVDNRTVALLESSHVTHGIWVDIFPIDNVPNGVWDSRLFLKKVNILRASVIAMTTNFKKSKLDKKYIEKRVLSTGANMIGKNRITAIYENTVTKYSEHTTGYVGCLSSAYIEKERYPISWFHDYINVTFEGKDFMAIAKYDEYLSALYGNYMELPPVDKRKDHRIIAWKKDNYQQ